RPRCPRCPLCHRVSMFIASVCPTCSAGLWRMKDIQNGSAVTLLIPRWKRKTPFAAIGDASGSFLRVRSQFHSA
ncbi:hypothetical protein KUCAC02_032971, partial [Chaenocephalus aceratus]